MEITKQEPADCHVVELRQYTLRPGRRNELVTLFEREFIETQRDCGLHVLATFLDAAAADRFVWFRGFTDMAARERGLAAFYDGPVWQAHRDAANATMIDSDNVLLLRPLTGWPVPAAAGTWFVSVCALAAAADDALCATLHRAGGAWLVTEPSANTFPRLPVRSGEWVVVGVAPAPLLLPALLLDRLMAPPQTLRLTPTRRSRLS